MVAGQRVLVVGGGMGIGAKITEYLLKQHLAKVVVLGLHISEQVSKLQTTEHLQIVRGDITSAQIREETQRVVLNFLGGLDSLICTVGIVGEIQVLQNMSFEKVQETYNVNVFAPMLLSQLFLKELRQNKGNIIILSSAVDKTVKYSGWIQYCSSKAALTRFIEVLDHEEPDVQVHGVYPGLTRTTMVDDMIAGKYAGIMKDDEVKKFITWDKEDSIDPPEWCANSVAKMSCREVTSSESGKCRYYHEYDANFRKSGTRATKL